MAAMRDVSGGTADPGVVSGNLVCNEIWGGNRDFRGQVELPGMRGFLYTQSCEGTRGGDVHYLSVCGSGLLSRVCLADVTGHGERVAAISDVIHKLLRRSVNRWDQRAVLRQLNRRLCEADGDSFVTAGMLTYFPPTRRLSVSYAGHEPAWYFSAAQHTWSRFEPGRRRGRADIALAIEPRSDYTRRVHTVDFGDRLMLLTDGVLEAQDKSGELFGRDRLGAVLFETRPCDPQDVVAAIVAAARRHAGGASGLDDDASVLVLEFVQNLKGPAIWTALRNRLFPGRR